MRTCFLWLAIGNLAVAGFSLYAVYVGNISWTNELELMQLAGGAWWDGVYGLNIMGVGAVSAVTAVGLLIAAICSRW